MRTLRITFVLLLLLVGSVPCCLADTSKMKEWIDALQSDNTYKQAHKKLYWYDTNELLPVLYKTLETSDSELTVRILKVIHSHGRKAKEACPTLTDYSKPGHNEKVRVYAVRALGEVCGKEQIPYLSSFYQDDSNGVRGASYRALGFTNSKEAVDPLLRSLKNENSRYPRRMIFKALYDLARYAEHALPALYKHQKKGYDKDTQIEIYYAIKQINRLRPSFVQKVERWLISHGIETQGTVIAHTALALVFFILLAATLILNPIPTRKARSRKSKESVIHTARINDQSLIWLVWYGLCLFIAFFVTLGFFDSTLSSRQPLAYGVYGLYTTLSLLFTWLISLFLINQLVAHRTFEITKQHVRYTKYVLYKKPIVKNIPLSEYRGILACLVYSGDMLESPGHWEIWFYARNPEYTFQLEDYSHTHNIEFTIASPPKRAAKEIPLSAALIHSQLKIVRQKDTDRLTVPRPVITKRDQLAQKFGVEAMSPAFIWNATRQIIFPEITIDEKPEEYDHHKVNILGATLTSNSIPVFIGIAAMYFVVFAQNNEYDRITDSLSFIAISGSLGALVGALLTWALLPKMMKTAGRFCAMVCTCGFLFYAMGLYYNGKLGTGEEIFREATIISKKRLSAMQRLLLEKGDSNHFVIKIKYRDNGEVEKWNIYDFKEFRRIKTGKSFARAGSIKGYFGYDYHTKFQIIHPHLLEKDSQPLKKGP